MSEQQVIPNTEVKEGIVSAKDTSDTEVHYVFTFCVGYKLINNTKRWPTKSENKCREIENENGVFVKICSTNNLNLIFLVKGMHTDVVNAKRKIIEIFQNQDINATHIPVEYHCKIGPIKGPKNKIKEYFTVSEGKYIETSQDDNSNKTPNSVTQITRERFERTIEYPKVYSPFIVGVCGKKLKSLVRVTGVDITFDVSSPTTYMNTIIICGDEESVDWITQSITDKYKEIEKKILIEIFVEVPKITYNYFKNDLETFVDEIFEKTNVFIEFPEEDCLNKETVILRGLYEDLSFGLNSFYEKIESVVYKSIVCPSNVYRYLLENNMLRSKLINDTETVHVVTYYNDLILVEGPDDEVYNVVDKLETFIEDYIFKECTYDKKIFSYIFLKWNSSIKAIENNSNVKFSINKKTRVIYIEGGGNNVKMGELFFAKMISQIKYTFLQEIFINQKSLKLIGKEIIANVEKTFNVKITYSDSGIFAKIRGYESNINSAYTILNELSMEENIRYLIHNPNRHEELNKKIAKEYFDSNNVVAKKQWTVKKKMCTEIKINQFPSEVTYDNNEINIKVTVDSVNKDCTINEAKVDDNECCPLCRNYIVKNLNEPMYCQKCYSDDSTDSVSVQDN